MSLRKGKRPWIFCFNPQCPSRQNKDAIIAPEDNEPTEEDKENNSEEEN